MANYATLKAAVNQYIRTNGNKEITGSVLNSVLNTMIDSLGANYMFAGVATPSTNPGTPDQNVAYLAFEAGTYTNFNATVLPDGISLLLWNGAWSAQTFFTIDDEPTAGSDNLVKSGGVYNNGAKVNSLLNKSDNIFYGGWFNAQINGTTGAVAKLNTGLNSIVNELDIEVSGNTAYFYLLGTAPQVTGTLYVAEYDSAHDFISMTNLGGSGLRHTFTTNASTQFIRFMVYKAGATVAEMTLKEVMLCTGDYKSYVPYYIVDKYALDYTFLNGLYAELSKVGHSGEGADFLYNPEYKTLRESVKHQLDSILSNFAESYNLYDGIWENADINGSGEWIDYNTGLKNIANRTFIPVESNTEYLYAMLDKIATSPAAIYVAEYDANKEFIQKTNLGTSTQRHTFTTASTTKYIRLSMFLDGASISNMISDGIMICKNADFDIFYSRFVISKNNIIKGLVHDILIRDGVYTQTKNIIPDGFKFVNGRIDGTSGTFYALTTGLSNAASDVYIPVLSARTYMLSSSNSMSFTLYISEYTSGKVFIRRESYGLTNKTRLLFTVSNTAMFIRIDTYKNNADWETIYPQDLQIELGGEATSFTEGEGLDKKYIDDVALYDKMANSGLVNPRLSIPYYYFWNNYLANKASTIKGLLEGCAGNGDAFIFISDIHWALNAKHSPALIQYLCKNVMINKMIDGGDDYNGAFITVANMLRMAMPKGEIHHITGNHDLFYPATNNVLAYNYDMYRKDQIGNSERRYYYVDDAQRKMRYVILSLFNESEAAAGTGASTSVRVGYGQEQLNWLENVALDAASDWSIVLMSHAFYEIGISTSEVEPVMAGGEDQTELIMNIINTHNQDETKAEIIFAVQGHSHRDRVITPEFTKQKYSLTDAVPVIITTCDKFEQWSPEGSEYIDIDTDRIEGTVSEQAFDVYVINKSERRVTAVRIGAKALDNVDNTLSGNPVEQRIINY